MRSRRQWYLGAGLAYLVIIAVVAAGLIGLYRASRQRLDEALGARLLAAASSVAVMVDSDQVFNYTIGDTTGAIYLDLLAADFLRLARQQELAEITLCDLDGVVLASSSPSLKSGQSHSYWQLDRSAVELAISGTAVSTRLYQLQTTYQKSAHVPVLKEDEFVGGGFVVGIITASGSPDFFDSLSKLRTGALVTGSLVLALLILLGILLHRINLSLERYRSTLQRQENLAAMGRMTAGIAHEIRNPLGIIRGAGQHLQRVLKDAAIEDEIADYIPEEVDRLNGILSGYLAFGTDAPPAVADIDLGKLTTRSAGLLEQELAQHGVAVVLELQEEVMVAGDPHRLQQVLLNLLLNARDAMPTGGKISMVLTAGNGTVCLKVMDQGQGLIDVNPDQLFEPFYTTKTTGSGLGLAMSKRIIEEMGGTLHLKPRTDEPGACATIILPTIMSAPGEG